MFTMFKKPECTIIFDEVQGRHRHKLTDRNDKSERFPTFFNGEDISGRLEIRLNSKTLKHKGIKAELHGIIEKYGTINKTKHFLNLTSDISRPEEITQEKIFVDFLFQNVKLPYESYKGDYASVKYYIKIIILSTYKSIECEKEFAVVNPYDSSILQNNDEPIQLQVGMKKKLSLAIYFKHKNYNCRGTLKGFILFNYINIPLKFMEVQIVRREVVFGDKKCEPAYVARYELIDGFPIKNERIPIRFFLKSYNLTPSYPNIDNIFCVRYFLNLVIADDEDNRYFKQKEICLFRLYKERKNYYGNNNNFNKDDYYYGNEDYYNEEEIFITEPIYEQDFSHDYQPQFVKQKNNNNNKQQDNNNNININEEEIIDNYELNPNIPSINENESFYFDYYNDNDNNNSNNFNNNNFNNNRNDKMNMQRNNRNFFDDNNANNDNNDNIYQRNRNRTFNKQMNDNNNKNFNFDNYNYNNNNYDDYNYNYNNKNYNTKNKPNQNNYNINFSKKNEIINNNPSNYHSIQTKKTENSYNDAYMFDDQINNEEMNNNMNMNMNLNSKQLNYSNNNNINNNKANNNRRKNLMKERISNEDDLIKLDKDINKEEAKNNIFG